MALLEVSDMRTFYGNIQALKGISLTVEEGEVVTLIGSNGAGKSTTLRSISGLTPPREGSIKFEGTEIGEVPPQEIVQRGISLSPEGRHVFSRMTVRENTWRPSGESEIPRSTISWGGTSPISVPSN